MKNSNSSYRTTSVQCVVRITSELKPHGATRLTARRSYRGRTPHARPSVLKEPATKKLRAQTIMLIRAGRSSQDPKASALGPPPHPLHRSASRGVRRAGVSAPDRLDAQ